MKAGKLTRTLMIGLASVAEARAKVGISQSEFTILLAVVVRTL
jgi:putative transcriptional regulator